MIISDFECTKCGAVTEDIIDSSVWEGTCPECRGRTKRLIGIGAVNTVNDDAPHIRESARTLLDPDTARHSDKAHVRDLALNPTRANLKRYMNVEKIRYVENEKGAPPAFTRPPKPDRTQQKEAAYEALRKSRAIEVTS